MLLFSVLQLCAQKPAANFEVVGAKKGCEMLVVNFTDRSTSSTPITSWKWDFGDGSAASTVQNPVKAYTKPGVYTVKLTVSNASGSDTKTLTNYISVFADPQPSFTISPTSGCVPLVVNFANTSTASSAIVKSEWNFGDGKVETSAATTIAHTYSTANTYSVSLTMTDANGCTATAQKPSSIKVNPSPVPDFTATLIDACILPITVDFKSTTAGNSYVWDFGDGSSETTSTATVSHKYTTEGTKTIKLTMTDANGCKNPTPVEKQVNITVFKAGFTAPDNVCVNSATTFSSTLPNGNGNSNTWYVAGEQKSTSQSYAHTFTSSGTYKVKLVSKNSIGCESTTEKDVKVVPSNEVQISTSKDKLCFDANQHKNVAFSTTIKSTNGQPITAWSWRITQEGSSNVITSAQENPTFTFPEIGTYTVSLQVRDAVCSGWVTAETKTIEVIQPTVTFDTLPNNQRGCLVDGKFPVQFNAKSNGNISRWSWVIDNMSNPAVPDVLKSGQDLLYTFTDTGAYKIKLTVEDVYGCKNETEDMIYIGKKIDPDLYKNFTSRKTVICYGPDESVATFDVDPNLPKEWTMLRWYWYNEDDEKLFRQDRKEDYIDYAKGLREDQVGDFTISLTPFHYACKSDEVMSTWTQTVLPPVAKFGIIADVPYPAMCDKGRPTTFVDMSQEVRTYTWYFGDNKGANAKNTTLTGHPIGAKGAPANSRLWEWKENGVVVKSDFFPKTSTNPVFAYKDYGRYHITLITETDTVNIPEGCIDSVSMDIWVTKVNPAMSVTSAKELCLGTALEAKDISTTEAGGKMIGWLWNFGDGNTGTTEKISYTYPQAGNYNLRLRVTDMYGCHATTASVPITVWNNPSFDATTIVNPRDCASRAMTFKDNAKSNEPTARLKSWLWTFEAGNSITISNNFNGKYKWTDASGTVIASDTVSKNPSYTFASAGTKLVTLKVTDEHDCSFQNSIQTILSRVVADIQLRDTVTPLGADYCYDTNIQLYNASSTSTYSVESKWNLGDNLPEIALTGNSISLEQSPQKFKYRDFGKDTTITVRLEVTERKDVNPDAPGCSDVAYKAIRISRPVSRFSADERNLACPYPPKPIQFHSKESTTSITSVAWNFGDGTPISTMPEPQHIYDDAGEFPVTLTVTDKFGCVDTRKEEPFITIEGPRGAASATPNWLCVPFPSEFTSKKIEKAVSARWVFGDGNVREISPKDTTIRYTFTHGDTFVPVLELTDDKKCTVYKKAEPINAYEASPDFTIVNDITCSNTPIAFADASISSHPITNWEWKIKNTDTNFLVKSEDQNTTQTLPSGNYDVSLTVKIGGCEFDKAKSPGIQVYATPAASFTTLKTEINKFEELLFTNTSTPGGSEFPTFYVWNFGDDTPEKTTFNTSHMYTRNGSFDVTLSAFEHENCVDVATKTITVRNKVGIPNVFTPNGDGINDIFIEGGFFKNIIIINRWGQTLYEGVDGWDGRVNGVEASPGTYFYIITTLDDEVVKGALTLIRE